MLKIFLSLFFLSLISFNVFSETKVEYPELLVSPRASERLSLEATREKTSFLNGYDFFIAAGLATTVSGLYSNIGVDKRNPDNRDISYLTMGVGGAFTLLGGYLAKIRKPYHHASESIKILGEGSTKAKLIKERIAEERIDSIATFNKRLRFFMGTSQIGLGMALLATAKKDLKEDTPYQKESENKKSFQAGAINIAVGVLNFILPHPSETVSRRQQEYKKKIYTYVFPAVYNDAPGIVAGIIF